MSDISGIQQHALRYFNDLLARLGQSQKPLAPADEQLDAEFVFQILDVLAHPRLGGEQRAGDLGQVEVAADRFLDDAQLLEIQIPSPSTPTRRSFVGGFRPTGWGSGANKRIRAGFRRTRCPTIKRNAAARSRDTSTS